MKIQEIKTSKFDGFGVLVPDYSQEYELATIKGENYIICSDIHLHKREKFKLTRGQYKIIGIQTEIIEEQAKEIVPCSERHDYMFPNYLKESDRYINLFNTALESFNSLMQKLEIKPDTKTLIIQKIK